LLGLTLSIFLCVLLHELGHSCAARWYGIETEDINLLPIGGLARLEQMPRKPTQELVIADYPFEGPFTAKKFVFLLFSTNLILVVFNMVPAFPMDGGRVFRALLSYKMDYVKATNIASLVGRAIAIGAIAYGFYEVEMGLMLIGTFVFFAANTENRVVSLEGALEGYSVKDLLRKRYTVLHTNDRVSDGLSLLYKGLERNFLVLNEEKEVVGIVTSKLLLENQSTGLEKSLESVMRTDLAAVETQESLKQGYALIRQKQQPIVPVFEEGMLIGVVDHQTISDFTRAKNS